MLLVISTRNSSSNDFESSPDDRAEGLSVFFLFNRTKEKPCCNPGGCISPFLSCVSGGRMPASRNGLGWILLCSLKLSIFLPVFLSFLPLQINKIISLKVQCYRKMLQTDSPNPTEAQRYKNT